MLRASKKTPPDPYVKIESVATEGPACKSGVKRHDRIISVDDVDMRDATIDRVQEAVKGAPCSTVNIVVARGGQQVDFVITRVALKPRGDGRLEPDKEATTPTSAKAGAQEDDESHMSIGAPFGFKQLVHVTVDPTSASGFNGLPDGWEMILMQSDDNMA